MVRVCSIAQLILSLYAVCILYQLECFVGVCGDLVYSSSCKQRMSCTTYIELDCIYDQGSPSIPFSLAGRFDHSMRVVLELAVFARCSRAIQTTSMVQCSATSQFTKRDCTSLFAVYLSNLHGLLCILTARRCLVVLLLAMYIDWLFLGSFTVYIDSGCCLVFILPSMYN